MRLARPAVPAFADHRAIAHQHAANAGIGGRGIQAEGGEVQSPRHVPAVLVAEHGYFRRGFFTSSTASRKCAGVTISLGLIFMLILLLCI